MPSSAPPKMQAKTIKLMVKEFTTQLSKRSQAGQIHYVHCRHAGIGQCHDEHTRTPTEGRAEHAEREGCLFHDGDDQRWAADPRVVGGGNEQSAYQATPQPP